ncbi:unnamed protein product [Closterium sp. NIES-54]
MPSFYGSASPNSLPLLVSSSSSSLVDGSAFCAMFNFSPSHFPPPTPPLIAFLSRPPSSVRAHVCVAVRLLLVHASTGVVSRVGGCVRGTGASLSDGNCVACVDVIHLIHEALSMPQCAASGEGNNSSSGGGATAGAGSGGGSNEAFGALMQRFWDSALRLHPSTGDDASRCVLGGGGWDGMGGGERRVLIVELIQKCFGALMERCWDSALHPPRPFHWP